MTYGLSDQELKGLILTVGSHRRERVLSPIEVGRLFAKMKSEGATLADCAAVVHLDGTAMVSRFLRLLSLGEDGEIAVDWGRSKSTIGFSSAFEIARLPSGEQAEACRAAIENGMSKDEVGQLVQYRLGSGKSIADCISQILKLRPHIERRYMYVGRIDDARLVQKLQSLTQAERDAALKRALASLDSRLEASSGRLSTGRFSIVGDRESSDILAALQPDFENAVIDQLRETVG